MPEDMRADPFLRNPNAFFQPDKQECDAIDRERPAGFGEKEMIFAGASPIRQFFLVGAVLVQVLEQVTLAVLAKSDLALL